MAEPSPLVCELTEKVGKIEARLAVLDTEIAEREQERDGLHTTLTGIRRLLDPGQIALPLEGLGAPAAAPKARARKLTAKGEELLRIAIAKESRIVEIPRAVSARGAVIAVKHLAGLDRPLFEDAGTLELGPHLYRLTADGETVARALPANGGANG